MSRSQADLEVRVPRASAGRGRPAHGRTWRSAFPSRRYNFLPPMEGELPRRIQVCGCSGSGKTTLAKAIAEKLGYPHIELDALFHGPKWTPTPVDEFRAKVETATSQEKWTLDGNYSKVRDIIFGRTDTVLWLDYPFALVMSRLIRRTLRRAYRREVLWNENREVLWKHLLPWNESLIWWVIRTYRRRKRQYREFSRDPRLAHINFVRFTRPEEAEAWIRSLPSVQEG